MPTHCSNCGKKVIMGEQYYVVRGAGHLCPKCFSQYEKLRKSK